MKKACFNTFFLKLFSSIKYFFKYLKNCITKLSNSTMTKFENEEKSNSNNSNNKDKSDIIDLERNRIDSIVSNTSTETSNSTSSDSSSLTHNSQKPLIVYNHNIRETDSKLFERKDILLNVKNLFFYGSFQTKFNYDNNNYNTNKKMGNGFNKKNKVGELCDVQLSEEEIGLLLQATKMAREQILEFHEKFLLDCPSGALARKDFIRMFLQLHPNEDKRKKCEKFCDYVFK
jgi:hypothetical protein